MTAILKERVMGNSDLKLVSNPHVERANRSMGMRRFARLINGFSKRVENHAHAVNLYVVHYNFCRVHTSRTKAKGGVHQTPAMAAGITDRIWKIETSSP